MKNKRNMYFYFKHLIIGWNRTSVYVSAYDTGCPPIMGSTTVIASDWIYLIFNLVFVEIILIMSKWHNLLLIIELQFIVRMFLFSMSVS